MTPQEKIQALPLPIHEDSVSYRRGFQQAIADVLACLASPDEAPSETCQAERCVCGHFGCVHNGAQYRGRYVCSDCDCEGFQPTPRVLTTGEGT